MANIVAAFDTPAQAEEALQRLRSMGVPDADISIGVQSAGGNVSDITRGSTSLAAWSALVGGLIGSIAGLFIGLGTVTIPSLGLVASGGPMATTLLGAGVGVATGGLVGALAGAGTSPEDALADEAKVKDGKVVVAARVPDDQVEAARQEMSIVE